MVKCVILIHVPISYARILASFPYDVVTTPRTAQSSHCHVMGLHVIMAKVYECIFVLTVLCWSQTECGQYGRTGSYGSYWNSEWSAIVISVELLTIVGNSRPLFIMGCLVSAFCMCNIVEERYQFGYRGVTYYGSGSENVGMAGTQLAQGCNHQMNPTVL